MRYNGYSQITYSADICQIRIIRVPFLSLVAKDKEKLGSFEERILIGGLALFYGDLIPASGKQTKCPFLQAWKIWKENIQFLSASHLLVNLSFLNNLTLLAPSPYGQGQIRGYKIKSQRQ